MINQESIDAAIKASADELGITVQERKDALVDRMESSRQARQEKPWDGCLSYYEWDCWFEGTLSHDRLKHLSNCKACLSSIKASEVLEHLALQFRNEATANHAVSLEPTTGFLGVPVGIRTGDNDSQGILEEPAPGFVGISTNRAPEVRVVATSSNVR